MQEMVNLGSIKPGNVFVYKNQRYLRIVTHPYTCNCLNMSTWDIEEIAPGILVKTDPCISVIMVNEND